ncbi:MAG: M23 family metallopeptidase [Bacteroidales bacterium]|nr:M23 family metallopeptidase [Bacteroidales bacterium]
MQHKRLKIFLIPIIALMIILLIIVFFKPIFKFNTNKPSEVEVEVAEPRMMYGFNVDTLTVVSETVRHNQFLANILLGYNVDYTTIDRLARETRRIFDVRKMRQGHNYSVILTNDSVPKARYFIYEISAIDYVVYSLKDSIHAWRGQKEVETRIETAYGVINSSLWNAMVANKTDPNLAISLSDIYAWTIDFFGIQKGDYYKVIYENVYVEGERIGIGRVLAATFNHFGKDQYAYYFVQDSVGEYFDNEGNSLRRAFLKAPLNYRRISSTFSNSRLHPVLKIRRPHHGVDYAAATGTPVMSIGDGVVEYTKWDNKGGGNVVRIKHNSVYSTAYLHLSKFGPGIKRGVRVKQGQVIGYVGSTGLSTGPHLDFRFYKNGSPVDPLKVESPPVEPVKQANMERFNVERSRWLQALEKVSDDQQVVSNN